MTTLELLAAIRKETGITVVGSDVPRRIGEVVRSVASYAGVTNQPFLVVREATAAEVERHKSICDRMHFIPNAHQWRYWYVLETD